ncbi:hypothetical protein CTA2_8603 [Colletotrichum tanaceti]|nr:hypothetical protein CTA2_8603 [Colletotrichum tanaceti]
MGPFLDAALFDSVVLLQFLDKIRHTAKKWVVDNRVVLRKSTSASGAPSYLWSPDITKTWFVNVDTVQSWLRTLGKRNTLHVDARFPPLIPASAPALSVLSGNSNGHGHGQSASVTTSLTHASGS